mgnify:CR=1 FL=1
MAEIKKTVNFESLLRNKSALKNMHSTDIAKMLDTIHNDYEERFYHQLENLPDELLGEVIIHLPEKYRYEVLERLPSAKLKIAIEQLETDDATDLIQEIEEVDELKANAILSKLDKASREEIKRLMQYEEDEAGAIMQTELFNARANEKIKTAIQRLKKLKNDGELENIHQVFIVDDDGVLKGGIWLEDLIIYDFEKTFYEVLRDEGEENLMPKFVNGRENIKEVIKKFEQYDLSVIAVVDENGKLLGRITSDDMYDVIEENATEQIYNLAGVNDVAEAENDIIEISKKRGVWLFINLFTAVLGSTVISFFDSTIESLVALAILMPIVASMGGNAGNQSLAVVVRQLALGTIIFEDARETIKKEVKIALINGFTFASLIGLISFLWFSNPMLGVVIGAAMILNLLAAGFFGAAIPLGLKRLNIDPAIGSTVLLTAVTDIFGFFVFLGLAALVLL